MRHILEDVATFHAATDTPVATKPGFPSKERRELRRSLIREEVAEFIRAEYTNDLLEVADSLADMIYVIVGTALEYGVPLHNVWAEVQRANMAKVDPKTGKVRKREDGKVLKPSGWSPPDIKKAMKSGS